MDKPKVLLLIPNLDFGGAQRVFYDHALLLAQKYEVIECAFNFEGGNAYPSANKTLSLGVPAGKGIFDKVFRLIQRCWRMHQIKRKVKPVLSISHLEGADYVNLLSFGNEKKIVVVHGSKVHDKEINGFLGLLRKKLFLPLLYKRADLVVTVSEGIKRELVDYFGLHSEKIITIYNSFDNFYLKLLSEEEVSLPCFKNGKCLRIITSGRLAKQKNHVSLLYILKELKLRSSIDVQLFIVGNGPLKDTLISEAKKLSLTFLDINDQQEEVINPDIVLLGYQKNPFRFYKKMDLFLFPSAWEGFPMALGEAMALGMPVISSDCPTGPLELLDMDWEKVYPVKNYPRFTSNGILVPVPEIEKKETIKMWVDVVLEIASDEERKKGMGNSAKQRMMILDKKVLTDCWLRIEETMGRNGKSESSHY